jgi:cytidylate kinase
MYASAVSAIPEVRAFLLDMQRDLARRRSVIMDGRDIGTVVLPDADVKIYLTADVGKRARRRLNELIERGTPRRYEEVLQEMIQRDWDDTHREIAPLREAEDAIRVDTSDLNFEESKAALLDVIRRRLGEE